MKRLVMFLLVLVAAAVFRPVMASAADVYALSLSPSSVIGGKASTATVKLDVAAPAGGLIVSLSSDNAAVATVPAKVTVAAGLTSATFSVTTKPVTTRQSSRYPQ